MCARTKDTIRLTPSTVEKRGDQPLALVHVCGRCTDILKRPAWSVEQATVGLAPARSSVIERLQASMTLSLFSRRVAATDRGTTNIGDGTANRAPIRVPELFDRKVRAHD